MSNKQGKNWFRFGWHPAEEELLLFLDGEASERQAGKVRAHLERCWACRNRRDKFDRAIVAFMDFCEAETGSDSSLPPRASLEFAERLRLAASAEPGSSLLSRWAMTLRWQFAQRRMAVAAIACLLVIASLAIIFRRAERTVSAQELLQRTAQAETLSLRRVGEPVVYRKLQVKRVGTSDAVVWESWSDAERKQFRQRVADKQGLRFLRADETAAPALLAELEKVLGANHFDAQRPLSAAAFAEWRQSIQPKAELVSQQEDKLTLTTIVGPQQAPNTIREASLTVRESDWHAVALVLNVQGERETRAYEILETAYEVLPLQALTVFSDLPPAPLASAVMAKTSVSRPTATPVIPAALKPLPAEAELPAEADLKDAEVAALYTLHQLKADLGEQIEVVREADRQITVRGLVETEARKQQLTEALRAVPLVIPHLQTIEEAARQLAAKTPANAAEINTFAAPEISASTAKAASVNPFQQSLETYFVERGSERRKAALKAAQLSDAIVSETAAALSEAWALRRLAERFKPEQEDDFTAPNRQRVLDQRILEMMRNHLARLQVQRRSLHAQLDPVLSALAGAVAPPAAGSAGHRQARALQLFRAVEQFAHLSNGLFAGKGGDSPQQAARSTLAALAQWEGALRTFEQALSK
jgi:hypothetical protein